MRRSGRWLLGVVLVCGLPMAAKAQARPNPEPDPRLGTVSTSAVARTRLPNTVADVQVGIETDNKDQALVTKALVDQSAALMAYLKSTGAERLRTGQIRVDTQTHTAKSGQESIVGYSGSVTVSFRVPADKLGDVVSGALTHGANKVEETSLTARESEIDAARKALAVEATKTAMAEARAVTEAAGGRVLGVKEVSVLNTDTSGPLIHRPAPGLVAYKQMDGAPVAVAAGDEELSVTVSVTLTIFHEGEPE